MSEPCSERCCRLRTTPLLLAGVLLLLLAFGCQLRRSEIVVFHLLLLQQDVTHAELASAKLHGD
jgi:hypothetical protein